MRTDTESGGLPAMCEYGRSSPVCEPLAAENFGFDFPPRLPAAGSREGSQQTRHAETVLLFSRLCLCCTRSPLFCRSRACLVAGAMLFAVVSGNLACHDDLHDAAKTRDIYSAARYGDLRSARALLKDNPDLALSKDLDGRTALDWAAANRQLAVAELLLAYHADVNARSTRQTTPLHEAAGAGDKEVAELLLTHGADINARDKSGGTPLHWAVLTDRRGVAELLLARHAAVNAKTALGYTPLQMAASMGHEEMAELLLANNALVNTIANDGSTPLHRAVAAGNNSLAELLRQHGGRE